MNSYLERLSSLNEDGKFGEEFTGGTAPNVTTQELLGAMCGLDSDYSDFIVNLVHKKPCTKETRERLVIDCIKEHKRVEERTRKTFKERKPLDDDECFGLACMAIDWTIQGYVDLTEIQVCKFASNYMVKSVNVSNWRKKYEAAFLTMLFELQSKVQDICNAAKENTGIYEQ